MKIPLLYTPNHRAGRSRRHERGSAVVVLLLFLAIVFAYIVANARTLHYLGRELRLIEHRQIHRLAPQPHQGHLKTQKRQGANPKETPR
jgi:hypothetical protein